MLSFLLYLLEINSLVYYILNWFYLPNEFIILSPKSDIRSQLYILFGIQIKNLSVMRSC